MTLLLKYCSQRAREHFVQLGAKAASKYQIRLVKFCRYYLWRKKQIRHPANPNLSALVSLLQLAMYRLALDSDEVNKSVFLFKNPDDLVG